MFRVNIVLDQMPKKFRGFFTHLDIGKIKLVNRQNFFINLVPKQNMMLQAMNFNI